MKTLGEVNELITNGETHNVEFKSKFEADKVGRAICALANDWPQTGIGILIIGVDDKTMSVIGFQDERDKLQRDIAEVCRSAISPPIAPVIHIEQLEKPVLVVEISTARDMPIRYRNDCYIRIGTTTRSANFTEELTLYKRAHSKRGIHVPEDRLPTHSRPISFTGREEELTELWQWMKDKKSYRCALSGDGGKGKTAIAYEFSSRIAESSPELCEFVLWASAKRKQFIHGESIPITAPDFKDLVSLLDKLLTDIGFPEDIALPIEEKESRVLELLTTFPALIVIDDLDSIDWSTDIETMEFITYTLPHTKSKVLITTRRQIPSVLPIFISGFNEAEGLKFIDSRIRLSGMDTTILNKDQKKKILQVTDSSALYIEDLLRLFVITGDFEETITQWFSRSGDEARIYALKREFELLPNDAKQALLAFSVLDEPATSAEAKAIAGITWSKWNDAIDELQRLFLIPRPGIIEGIHRFSINSNTKNLVLTVMEDSQEIAKFKQNVRNISGESYKDMEKRKSVGAIIRQASAFIRIKDCATAELTIKEGIKKLGEDPDLLGALGWVYKCHTPPRIVDARTNFRRAAELKCNNHEMYKHWYEMEDQNEYFGESMEAARSALTMFPKNYIWASRLGYASGRYGERLVRQLQPRGRMYLARANKILESLIAKLNEAVPFDSGLHMISWRSYVLNCAALYNSSSGKEKDRHCNQFASGLKVWIGLYGDDPAVDYESTNLLTRYPAVKILMKKI